MPTDDPQLVKVGTQAQHLKAAPANPEDYRAAIEPWLSALFQSEHLNFLVGNGLSIATAFEAGISPPTMPPAEFGADFTAAIAKSALAGAAKCGRGVPNLEDELRAALELYAGLMILSDARANSLETAIGGALLALLNAVTSFESDLIVKVDADAQAKARVHRRLGDLLLSMANRPTTRERLHIFTLNYDRLIEYACDVLGLRILDRFVGTLQPRFRTTRLDVDFHYNPPGIRGEPRYLEGVVRFTKLHGSLDWRLSGTVPTRIPSLFGQTTSLSASELFDSLLVFPNAAKDAETAFYPYAELFRDFASAACRPNTTLVAYGYSFGDDHVNRVIRDMLTLPSTHLVIIAFSDVGGRISRFVSSVPATTQITLLVGSHFGDLGTLCDMYLPRPDLDRILNVTVQALKNKTPDIELPGTSPPADAGDSEEV